MKILTTQPLQIIPGVVADGAAISLTLNAMFNDPSKIGASAQFSVQRYAETQSGIMPAGKPLIFATPDVYAEAAKSSEIAAQIVKITEGLAALVPLLKL